ncbi:MAG TPA: hypothetical protein V6C72_04155 [Chroococcales cyanobacterium]
MEPSRLCEVSLGQEDDWVQLYKTAFPADERHPVDSLRQRMASGSVLLHKTVNSKNELLCFSIVYLLSDFVLLSYIATDSTRRSSGVGSKHMNKLVELIRAAYPARKAMFLEIESTKEKNLDAETLRARVRRLAFYERLGARRSDKPYLMPSYGATTGTQAAKEGELLWIELQAGCITNEMLPRFLEEIYTRGYGVSADHPLVKKVLAAFSAVDEDSDGVGECATVQGETKTGSSGDPLIVQTGTAPDVVSKQNSREHSRCKCSCHCHCHCRWHWRSSVTAGRTPKSESDRR